MVRVFTYQAGPAGRVPEEIAEEAFAIFNGQSRHARDTDVARRYHERRLRSSAMSWPSAKPGSPSAASAGSSPRRPERGPHR
jgi:hypothetical protein